VRHDRTEADDIVQGAYNRALLELILPPMRRVAKDLGYAITVHGSLCRDIDLVAVPWTEQCSGNHGELALALSGAIASITGRCHRRHGEWTKKPHGRLAITMLAWCGETTANIDLSVVAASRQEQGSG
jgi:hypothetical protein